MVIPFSLTNAPATFQAYINKSLIDLINQFCVVYLNNILIYSKNPEAYIEHVKRVLDRLRQASLFISLKKCEFFTIKVEFLSFIISIIGVIIDPRRIAAIQK